MSSCVLFVSLAGSNLPDLATQVRDSYVAEANPPRTLSVDDKPTPISADWLDRSTSACRRSFFAAWDESLEHFLSYDKDFIVKASRPLATLEASKVLSWLETVPFSVATFGRLYPEWRAFPDFPVAGFGDLHFPLGWACAFRGDGHRRLVSRRWLEFGPWRLLRGQNDTSFVQFHDPAAPYDAAFAQARPGHERMGISDTGGFIQTGYVYSHRIDGLYNPGERRLRILVHGRQVSELEMLDACAVRFYQALGPKRPVDSIAYVFAVEEEARAHLHQLWLRELECWAIVAGREVRLDADYHPVPARPDWVRTLGQS
jgi:hypothetical protein